MNWAVERQGVQRVEGGLEGEGSFQGLWGWGRPGAGGVKRSRSHCESSTWKLKGGEGSSYLGASGVRQVWFALQLSFLITGSSWVRCLTSRVSVSAPMNWRCSRALPRGALRGCREVVQVCTERQAQQVQTWTRGLMTRSSCAPGAHVGP